MSPAELYLKAIADEPRISALLQKAEREEKFSTTKDWSFIADRMTGENWILVGEATGFADPILSAGLSLTHTSAREAAFTLLEIDRGGSKEWLCNEYFGRNKRRILQHIRFADYWYRSNKHFSELKEFTSEIARDAGLELDAEKAFQWLGTGGFIEEDIGIGGFGTIGFSALHQVASRLSETAGASAFSGYNGFVLNFEGAKRIQVPVYEGGRALPIPAYTRNGKILPLNGVIAWLVKSLESTPRIADALAFLQKNIAQMGVEYNAQVHEGVMQCLEALVRDGWVECRRYKAGEVLPDIALVENTMIQDNHDHRLPPQRVAGAIRDEAAIL
jgi:hypothetical protein